MLAGLKRLRGFTLIELLIVIAIILILIAIALPNFLEAQIRARVTKASSELRTLQTATESYRIDWGMDPPAHVDGTGFSNAFPDELSWWGLPSHGLTTPNAYITELPEDPFFDPIFSPFATGGGWIATNYTPYNYIRDTATATWPVGMPYTSPSGNVTGQVEEIFNSRVCKAGYIYYSAGPDNIDASVYGAVAIYAPTNGTKSYGDIYVFGEGSPYDDIKYTVYSITKDQMRDMVHGNCGW